MSHRSTWTQEERAERRRSLLVSRLRELLSYDQQTGRFAWLVYRGGGSPEAGRPAGTVNHPSGYVYIRVDGIAHYAHRLAWLYVYGLWPEHTIDHINGVKDDNRIENLRDVPHIVNMRNQRQLRRNNRSGYAGVHEEMPGKFRVVLHGRYIGIFNSIEEAARARQIAQQENAF